MPALPNKDLFRPDEVARYFQVSTRTIYFWIDSGQIEAVRLPGKTLRVRREVILNTAGKNAVEVK